VQLVGTVDLNIDEQRDPGTLDIPPKEVECIAVMDEPLGFSQHTALFDYFDTNLGGGTHLKFRTTMGSPTSYPNGGNDIKDVGDLSIGELHGLQSSLLEFLEPNSPTLDEHDDDSGSAMGLSSLETIDQEQFTWQNVKRTDAGNPAVGETGDSDGEITLNELI
jgi:hypothetical protein